MLLTLDVNDASSTPNVVLGTLEVRRGDFLIAAADTPVSFTVPFTNSEGDQLEFRVKFHGGSYVLHLKTQVN